MCVTFLWYLEAWWDCARPCICWLLGWYTGPIPTNLFVDLSILFDIWYIHLMLIHSSDSHGPVSEGRFYHLDYEPVDTDPVDYSGGKTSICWLWMTFDHCLWAYILHSIHSQSNVTWDWLFEWPFIHLTIPVGRPHWYFTFTDAIYLCWPYHIHMQPVFELVARPRSHILSLQTSLAGSQPSARDILLPAGRPVFLTHWRRPRFCILDRTLFRFDDILFTSSNHYIGGATSAHSYQPIVLWLLAVLFICGPRPSWLTALQSNVQFDLTIEGPIQRTKPIWFDPWFRPFPFEAVGPICWFSIHILHSMILEVLDCELFGIVDDHSGPEPAHYHLLDTFLMGRDANCYLVEDPDGADQWFGRHLMYSWLFGPMLGGKSLLTPVTVEVWPVSQDLTQYSPLFWTNSFLPLLTLRKYSADQPKGPDFLMTPASWFPNFVPWLWSVGRTLFSWLTNIYLMIYMIYTDGRLQCYLQWWKYF